MCARVDARTSHILNEITRPDDPRLAAFAMLLLRTFSDPNSVLGLDRMQEFLTQSSDRTFHVVVAEEAGRVIGGSVFSYVPRSNCGFSEYLLLQPAARGRGMGRQLFDRRREILNAQAVRRGFGACRGLFIEVDSPQRTPPEMLEAERESSIDVHERLRIFGHLGFRRVDVAYVQPPLDADKQAVDYLDLLFAAWESEAGGIPAEWILETVEPIWKAWTGPSAAEYLEQLRERIGARRRVALESIGSRTAE
jgi:GNAT superfamily N-acetyltransferase